MSNPEAAPRPDVYKIGKKTYEHDTSNGRNTITRTRRGLGRVAGLFGSGVSPDARNLIHQASGLREMAVNGTSEGYTTDAILKGVVVPDHLGDAGSIKVAGNPEGGVLRIHRFTESERKSLDLKAKAEQNTALTELKSVTSRFQ